MLIGEMLDVKTVVINLDAHVAYLFLKDLS